MDKFAVMQAFCRIVARGSFVRAADDLGVSPALLSREIKRLEQLLGCSLLTRSTRRMSLTDHGRAYHDEALRILEATARLEAGMSERAGDLAGQLRVNAPASFGQVVLSAMLPGFLQAHPRLRLSLSFDDRLVDMVEGGFDLTIRVRAELPDSGLVARRLGDVRQRLFAAPSYLASHGEPVSVDELAAHQAVTYLLADDAMQWLLAGPSGRQVVRPEPRLRVGSSLVLRDMLVAGLGIGALPDFIADEPLRQGLLVRVLPQHELPARHVFAVTASRLALDAKVEAFLDHLAGVLAH